MTDHELISGCINRDRKFQKSLYEKYSGIMYAICLRYCHDRDQALDILQDGFIKVFNKVHTYQSQGSFEGWMKKIFIHTAINHYHKVRHLSENLLFQDEVPDTYSDQHDIISKLTERELLKLISTLPDGYRMVFNLYVIEGYDHEEIAKMLGITASTSRSQLVKARKTLQKKLKETKIIAA